MNRLGLSLIFIILGFISFGLLTILNPDPYIDNEEKQKKQFLNLLMDYMSERLNINSQDRSEITKIILSDFKNELSLIMDCYGSRDGYGSLVDFSKIKKIDDNKIGDCLNARIALFITFYTPKEKCRDIFNLIDLIKNSVKDDQSKGNYKENVITFTPIFEEKCG